MPLITHILWNDIKRLKWLLVLFVGLLIWYWAMSCYGVGWIADDLLKGEQLGFLCRISQWFINLFILVILFLLIHPDSVARQTSFFWCRPIPRSAGLLAKVFFTVLFLFCLPVLTEAATYWFYHAPAEKIKFLLLEIGAYQFVILVNAFLVATMAPRFKHFVGIGIVLVVLYLWFKWWLSSWAGRYDSDTGGPAYYYFLFWLIIYFSLLNGLVIVGQFRRVNISRFWRAIFINFIATVVLVNIYHPNIFRLVKDVYPQIDEVAKGLHVSLEAAGHELEFGKASFHFSLTQNKESLYEGIEAVPIDYYINFMTLAVPADIRDKIGDEIHYQIYHAYPLEDYMVGVRHLFSNTKILNERIYYKEPFNRMPDIYTNFYVSLQETPGPNAELASSVVLRIEQLQIESVCRKVGQPCSTGKYHLLRKIIQPGTQKIIFSRAFFLPSFGRKEDEEKEKRNVLRKRYTYFLNNLPVHEVLVQGYPNGEENQTVDWQRFGLVPSIIDRWSRLFVEVVQVRFSYHELDDQNKVLDHTWLRDAEFVVVRPMTLGYATHKLNYVFDPKVNKKGEHCGDGECGLIQMEVWQGSQWE